MSKVVYQRKRVLSSGRNGLDASFVVENMAEEIESLASDMGEPIVDINKYHTITVIIEEMD